MVVDLEDMGKCLKLLYNTRSKIAHGDFLLIKKSIKNKDDIYNLVEEIFDYVSTIVQLYIYDPDFIDSLKKL